MKKIWSAPEAIAEQFAANEYVAACGDSGVVYKFVCDGGYREPTSFWDSQPDYNVYLANGTPYATSGRDSGGCKTDYYSYSPCGSTHEADSDSVFLKGYMYEQDSRGNDSGSRIDVVIWTDNYTDVHCTASLDKSTWETAKS
jgi:hypothetical protein